MSFNKNTNKYGIPKWKNIIKYILEGIAVSVCAFLLSTKNNKDIQSVLLIGLSAALIFMILDMFAPVVNSSARQGAGFGIGFNLVGGGKGEKDDSESHDSESHDSESHDSESHDSESHDSESHDSETETLDSETETLDTEETFYGYPLTMEFDKDLHNKAQY